MHYFRVVTAILVCLLISACSPPFNWREVRPFGMPLLALFPCKPDESERKLAIGERAVLMKLAHCDTGGATFTLSFFDLKDAASMQDTIDRWKAASLLQIRASASELAPFPVKGASPLVPPFTLVAQGRKPDGSPLTFHAVWFAVGTQVFQAAVYANVAVDLANPGLAETYFSGLRLP